MRRKIFSFLLVLALLVGCTVVFSACGESEVPSGEHECIDADKDGKCDVCGKEMQTPTKHKRHVDDDKDGKCDVCGKDMEDDDPFEETIWDTTDLIYQMTKCSNRQELPSGCERYMAGEDDRQTEAIDDMIRTRNANALKYANVNVRYTYCPDATGYGWSANSERIYTEVMSKTADKPDMYTNFMTDIVNSSLKGSFANLYSTSRGVGELKGYNDFTFTKPGYDETVEGIGYGYMYEYMKTTTLSKFKMYVVASDYFLDLVRAFLVVPVNVKLLNSVVETVTGDINKDGECNIDDFYAMIEAGDWTYETVADYSARVYQASANNTGAADITDDIIGFASSLYSGLPTTGLIFTSSVVIINRKWSDERNDYDYWYPEENDALNDLCMAISNLFYETGVITVNNNYTEYGTDGSNAIRTRFVTDHVLFGNIICVGSLEYDDYQNMKNGVGVTSEDIDNANFGFGVAPVPLYRKGDHYLTQIHTIGKGGAISATTTKFAQCTRYFDYQSIHSTDILNEYYDYKLQYDIAGGTKGNVAILTYIRHNVRSAFDKVFEDAIGSYFSAIDDKAMDNRWNYIINRGNYHVENARDKYTQLYPTKEQRLRTLINEYDKLPD